MYEEASALAENPGLQSPNGLGECPQCRCGLDLRGAEVSCPGCGLTFPDHPVAAEDRRLRAALRPAPDRYPPPQDYPTATDARVAALERRLAIVEAALATVPRRR